MRPRKTSRILRIPCPLCDELLDVHVHGLGPVITPQEWLTQLTFEDECYLHTAHGGDTTFVSMREHRPSG